MLLCPGAPGAVGEQGRTHVAEVMRRMRWGGGEGSAGWNVGRAGSPPNFSTRGVHRVEFHLLFFT